MKGIRTLASITIFAIIYRYLTPVLITPFANKIGDKWNASKATNKEIIHQPAEKNDSAKILDNDEAKKIIAESTNKEINEQKQPA